ncbi:hypothetical protein DY000_02035184 [Brassica cretica]|uniref:HMA domain-containing protein n=1 Tax=Brassica cretica TaxID=69181 RepID=A0ABQ7DQ94_BRACR|nr:hypothetical protein DY000_02035184 [Brassica cretica]
MKALLEERLKVLGVVKIPENNDNPSPPSADKSLTLASPRVQKQQNSVNSQALAAIPGKVFGLKKNLAKELDKESGVKGLAEEFGSVAKATVLDSQHVDVVLISPSKATKDDKDAKVPAYGCGCRGKCTVKAKKKEAEGKKKEADLKKKQEAELKKRKHAESKNKVVTPYGQESVFADVTEEVVEGENDFAPETDVEGSEMVRSVIPLKLP